MTEPVVHNIAPVWNRDSRILILGSFPSVKSREAAFFYANPQNRFWKVLAAVFSQPVPDSTAEKTAFLLHNRIALWDVIASCRVTGSSDSSIRDAVPNDLSVILREAAIGSIFCNGATAYRLFQRHMEPVVHREAVRLPSTSPANASCSVDRLIAEWTICRSAADSKSF